jgi:hypothetical protein
MNKRNACKYFPIVLMCILVVTLMGSTACSTPTVTPTPVTSTAPPLAQPAPQPQNQTTTQPTVTTTAAPRPLTTTSIPQTSPQMPTTTVPSLIPTPASTKSQNQTTSLPDIANSTSTTVPPMISSTPAPTSASPTIMVTSTPISINSQSIVLPSDVTASPSSYDGKQVEVRGQAYVPDSSPILVVDGASGINLSGNVNALQGGFCDVTGVYNAATNTLNVNQFTTEQLTPTEIQVAKGIGLTFSPVSLTGLVATPPQNVLNFINSYIFIPHLTNQLSIYPYVVFTQDALYLALFSSPVQMPTKFRFGNSSITLSAGEVTGTLVKTPMQNINLGPQWLTSDSGGFGGIIIANSVVPLDPISATVNQINSNQTSYLFKRVTINDASYVIGTFAFKPFSLNSQVTNIPIGLGLMFDKFPVLFQSSPDDVINSSLLTLNPESNVCQLGRGQVTGTLIGPTTAISNFFLNKLPAGGPGFLKKPILIVDDISQGQIISTTPDQISPIYGDPSKYYGKVVQFDGKAFEAPTMSVSQVLSSLAPSLAMPPVDVYLNVIAVNDLGFLPPSLPFPDLIIIEFSNQFSIFPPVGNYRFTVAVSQMPNPPFSLPPLFPQRFAQTAYFLLDQEPIPSTPTPTIAIQPVIKIQNVDIPTTVTVGQNYNYNVTLNNSGASQVTVTLNINSSVTGVATNQPITVPANGSMNVSIQSTFASAGVRTVTYSVLYNNQVLDSLTKSVQANNPAMTTPPPTTTIPATTAPTTMSFNVSGGPFGHHKLTSYLVPGQQVNISFTISGGNDDIDVYIYDPSNIAIAGSATSPYYTSGQISFTALASGNYVLWFDNRSSLFTSKNIQVTIAGGQWN